MAALETDVLVIGGGVTGAGVAWDAALRGLAVVLVERHALAAGTSGRFHGLLHSGARYALSDPSAARECIAENRILRRIAADCIEDAGGLFVSTPLDDPEFAGRFAAGCGASGVPCEEIEPTEALAQEPSLDARISRAFRVPDAAIHGAELVGSLARAAQDRGGRILVQHEVRAITRTGETVSGARVFDARSGQEFEIHARVTVNATGPWAEQLAALAGIGSVRLALARGLMIAFEGRPVSTVINRCRPPGDGDILVPTGGVCVLGTTDRPTRDPDQETVDQGEVETLLEQGQMLVPSLRQTSVLRAWTGVRPLFDETGASETGTSETGSPEAGARTLTRTHALLDHGRRDGVHGFITITGGKLTTFRLMAEETVGAVCAQLGDARTCTTATHPLPAPCRSA